ncbi:hypothetical protein FQA39_LY14427 [Lamprigera yunnana]|nr:hypothetical protein FQA39_LY14427 [Lamprigera yunnana]
MMDTDSMGFCYEEHFPSYESSNFFTMDDESQSGEDAYNNNDSALYWDWEVEQEINGDIALIPMSSNIGMNYLSNSPPAREDFQKIMSEWQQYMSSEVSELETFNNELPLTDDYKNFIPESSYKVPQVATFSGKKMDLAGQCYIYDKEENVLDIKEEFDCDIKVEKDNDSENEFIDPEEIPDHEPPILHAGDVNSLLEQFEATENYQPKHLQSHVNKIVKTETIIESIDNKKVDIKEAAVDNKESIDNKESVDNKQILDALPEELIIKIKASSKRRLVPVIDAMPHKKRSKKMQPELSTNVTVPTYEKTIKNECVQLDHDYCSQSTPYPKHPQKDSGFESAEEDEQRSILKKQPTVKGADGKLMVSLLKVNTIRNSIVTENNKIKKKLNLEEYKKRREGFVVSSKPNNSIESNDTNTPTIVEDENMRLLKHQQKLMQMAEEVLRTPPKSALPIPIQNSVAESTFAPVLPVPPSPPRVLPTNIEVKTLVSMGVNTDMTSTNVSSTELEEIKPILQSATSKINDNSLITSVIKNMQKVKTVVVPQSDSCKNVKNGEHGEDKTIVYLDKCRPPIETRHVEVQTEPEIEDTTKHKRKRNLSTSSNEHRISHRRSSTDSHYSYNSRSSSTSSRCRSRSRSPKRVYSKKRLADIERERIREVEERRIVYVGRISSSMSKEGLRRRFQIFGPITNVSIHFRDYGDNYGFVTFMYKADAYKAVEHGNDDPMLPKYDLSFGGRRIFCRTHYADLDNVDTDNIYSSHRDDSFDNLLKEAKAKLRKRKTCT